MELKDVVTLLVALYGAVLSSINMIMKIIENKRTIHVILEHVYIQEIYRLVIINTGKRPVTITNIGISVNHGVSYFEAVPREVIFDLSEKPQLPFTLMDGEISYVNLNSQIFDYIRNSKYRIVINDAEGREYKIVQKRGYDIKTNQYTPIKK